MSTPGGAGKGVGRVAAVALLVVAVVAAAVWLQTVLTLRAGSTASTKISVAVVQLNTLLADFKGDPADARTVLAGIDTVEAAFSTARATSQVVARGPLPVGSASRVAYAAALEAYVDEGEAYLADITLTAETIANRGVVIQELSDGFGVLDELGKPGITAADVDRVISDVQATVGATLGGLESIESTGLSVYSSAPLVARLNSISAQLQLIRASLAASDSTGFAASTAAFGELLKADWQALFFAADTAGVERLAADVRAFGDHQESVLAARSELVAVRNAAGLLAVLAAAVGALAAAAAWLR